MMRLRTLSGDIFDIPLPDISYKPAEVAQMLPAPDLQSWDTRVIAALPGPPTAAGTASAWLARNQSAVLIGAGALLLLAFMSGGRRR